MNINELKVGDRVKYRFWDKINTGIIVNTYDDGFRIANDKAGIDGIVVFNDIICKLEPIYKEIPIDSKNREDSKTIPKGKCEIVGGFHLSFIPETKYYCKVCGKYISGLCGIPIDNYETKCAICERGETGPIYNGPIGSYGPNDLGYLNTAIRRAADILVQASELWSEGHYPHSNAKVMPEWHPIARALDELRKTDLETAQYANIKHDPKLFAPYVPSIKNQTRWDNSPIGVACLV